jgi:putative phosphoesterase
MWNWRKKRNGQASPDLGRPRSPSNPPKIVIVSDIHGNYEALRALPEDYDELWVLGDLVNYGPQPAEVIELVREKASLVVRGNHDDAVAFDRDPRCSTAFRQAAAETAEYTKSVLNTEQKRYLGELPLFIKVQRSQKTFYLCHAVPSYPLYAYCTTASKAWPKELEEAGTDFLFVGHTHAQFLLRVGERLILNPGSIGQPKSGSPSATYAVWENGSLLLRSYWYPVEKTVERMRSMPIGTEVQAFLMHVLETGVVPKSNLARPHVEDSGADRH